MDYCNTWSIDSAYVLLLQVAVVEVVLLLQAVVVVLHVFGEEEAEVLWEAEVVVLQVAEVVVLQVVEVVVVLMEVVGLDLLVVEMVGVVLLVEIVGVLQAVVQAVLLQDVQQDNQVVQSHDVQKINGMQYQDHYHRHDHHKTCKDQVLETYVLHVRMPTEEVMDHH